ncbi:hypothetical protein JCM6882_000921 [Rhodosporidiobolus microsporus]
MATTTTTTQQQQKPQVDGYSVNQTHPTAFKDVGGYRDSAQVNPFENLTRATESHDFAQPAHPKVPLQQQPQAQDDLREWAPEAPPFEQLQPSGMPHLPKASGLRILGQEKKKVEKGATSKPFNVPLTPLQASISYSLARLLSLPRFQAFLATPLGFAQFHAYLTNKEPASLAVSQLELYKDAKVLAQLLRQAGLAAKGINDVYLEEDGGAYVELPRETLVEFVGGLKDATHGAPGLDGPSKYLLHSLYASEFENFVRFRLLKHTKAQISRYHLAPADRESSGIGSAFLCTNPRLPDDPIVLVSPGFCQLTGYSAEQIIGRNCRFLQGKATAPQSVGAIRDRLEAGEEVTQVVINYRASGEPFVNMVNVIPLHDTNGSLTYFIGGQTDMTRAITTGSDLSFILPEDEALAVDMSAFSPAVQVEAREAQQGPGDLTIREVPPAPAKKSVAFESAVVEGDKAGKKGGDKKKKEKDVGVKQILSLKRHATTLFKKRKRAEGEGAAAEGAGEEGAAQQRGQAVPAGEEGHVAPTMADPSTMPLEKRMLDVQNTYEKLLVVRRKSREILFCTPGFLRFVGLPGTSKEDVFRSPLVHMDLMELVVAAEAPSPGSIPTKELRGRVRRAFEEATPLSTPCGLQVKVEVGGTESTPLVSGRVHLAPLLDLYGECSAVTVVFG